MVSDACATAVVVVVVVGSFSPSPSPSFFFLFSLQKAKRPSEHNKKKKRTSFSRALTNKGCGYDSSKREEKKKARFFFNWKLYPRVIYSRSFFFFFLLPTLSRAILPDLSIKFFLIKKGQLCFPCSSTLAGILYLIFEYPKNTVDKKKGRKPDLNSKNFWTLFFFLSFLSDNGSCVLTPVSHVLLNCRASALVEVCIVDGRAFVCVCAWVCA